MKVLLETITWMLCTLIVISTTMATPSTPSKDKLQYTKLTWKPDYTEGNKNNPKIYSSFISSIRTAYIPFGEVCEIPVTPKSRKDKADEFILVDITSAEENTITVAFQTSDLYFVGFQDKTTKRGTRANFVDYKFDHLKKRLFTDAKTIKKLPYGENYKSLENAAGVKSRQEVKLGLTTFSTYIDKIYGADYKGKSSNDDEKIGQSLAKFGLMAIQMIAEATRFIYIEGKVRDSGMKMYASFKPDDTFIELEKNWGSFSKLIHKSSIDDPGCDEPVKSAKFPKWPDIKKQVGLLNHVDKVVLGDVVPFMEGIFGNNDDDDVALEFIM